MNEIDLNYFKTFPRQLEDMVDAFLFTHGIDLSPDGEATELKDRLHVLRWDILAWLKSQ